jgi:hypothetical protein
MRQAVGLRPNQHASNPRALPWAGINQAFGLKTTLQGLGAKIAGNDKP